SQPNGVLINVRSRICPIYIKWHLGTYPANRFVVRPSVPKTKIVAAFGKRVSPGVDIAGDATMEFAAETAVAVYHPGARPLDRRRLIAGGSLGVVVIALITAGVYWKDRSQASAAVA